MDTSETYIKMCRKAKEIQELWEGWTKITGDRTVWKDAEPDSYGYRDTRQSETNPTKEVEYEIIWLPCQDQLQEMVNESIPRLDSIIPFWHNHMTINPVSWEQLWLAFVMKEKYNKTWNGETWNAI